MVQFRLLFVNIFLSCKIRNQKREEKSVIKQISLAMEIGVVISFCELWDICKGVGTRQLRVGDKIKKNIKNNKLGSKKISFVGIFIILLKIKINKL